MTLLLKKLKSIFFKRTLYPEIKNAGSLSKALDNAFVTIQSTLKTSADDFIDKIPVVYARVENINKFSQIYIAAEEKLYSSNFWRNGVCLAHASTSSITDIASSIDYWLVQDISTDSLSKKFDFVTPAHKADAFDNNKEVDYTWDLYINNPNIPELIPFIELAAKDDILSKLFPFTSLYTLCLSRCTGYPYSSENIPNVTPKIYNFYAAPNSKKINLIETANDHILFIVTKNKTEYIGEGNAEQALKMVKENLPKDIKPAVKGTAEDLLLPNNTYSINVHKYYKRLWNQTTADPLTNSWGVSTFYFETDIEGGVFRQIEVFQEGQMLRYDNNHLNDQFGGLADVSLDLQDFEEFTIDKNEFENMWCKQDVTFKNW
ncbi:MAG: hypothetical protein J0I41_07950 [Filimonas sp.]|nr:hypothetical protein [Filimonas sp.]